MNDVDKALAEAREVYIAEGAKFVDLDEKVDPLFRALGSVLAALDAARSQAVAWQSVRGGRLYLSRHDAVLNGEQMVTPLYAAPPAAVFKSTAKRVAALQARDATQAPPAAVVSDSALDAAVKGWTLDGGIGLRDALRGAIERAMLATQAPPAAAVPEVVGWLHEVVWQDGTSYSYHSREPRPLDPTPGLVSQRIGRAAMLAAEQGAKP